MSDEERAEQNLWLRKQALWWLRDKHIVRTPLHELVDEKDREAGIQSHPLGRAA